MIEFHEAQKTINELAYPLKNKAVNLSEALNDVLANDIYSQYDFPAFDHSAMDGAAIKASDLQGATENHPIKLKLIGEVYAGDTSNFRINEGQCCWVATGAKIPEGADTVVPMEYFIDHGNAYEFSSCSSVGSNIRTRGSFFKKETLLLEKGLELTSAEISLLACDGISETRVNCSPVVNIITTGNEVIATSGELTPGKLYNSNVHTISSFVKTTGCKINDVLHVADEEKELTEVISNCLESCDCLIIAGGISVGKKDYVKQTLEGIGVEIIFGKINVKPGKPFLLAKKELSNKLIPIFCLPGSPVAVFYLFRTLVVPYLRRMRGINNFQDNVLKGKLSEKSTKINLKRTELIPVSAKMEAGEYILTPCPDFSSSNLKIVVEHNALAIIPPSAEYQKSVPFIFI